MQRKALGIAGIIGALGAVVVLSLSGSTVVVPPRTGGGGGSSLTVTEYTSASISDGTEVVVTHPAAVPASDDYFAATAFATLAGAHNATKQANAWTPTEYATGGIEWVRDSAASGHFTVDPGDGVVAGCWMYLASTATADLLTVGADPTVADSVTISADHASEPISNLQCAIYSGGWVKLRNGAGTYPINQWQEVTSPALAWASAFQFMDAIVSWTHQTANTANTSLKMVLSPDSGTTWYYHNGAAWVSAASPIDWATKGLSLPNTAGAENLQSTDATDITPAEWAQFVALVTGDVRLKLALKTTDNTETPTLLDMILTYDKPDAQVELPLMGDQMGMSAGVLVKRIDSTHTLFYVEHGFGSTWSNWRLRVVTN